jgi:hypothetical protein
LAATAAAIAVAVGEDEETSGVAHGRAAFEEGEEVADKREHLGAFVLSGGSAETQCAGASEGCRNCYAERLSLDRG